MNGIGYHGSRMPQQTGRQFPDGQDDIDDDTDQGHPGRHLLAAVFLPIFFYQVAPLPSYKVSALTRFCFRC
jgi:hypothetical protein